MSEYEILLVEQFVNLKSKWSPYWAKQVVGEARSYHSAGHIKPEHRYDSSDHILEIGPAAKPYSKIAEGQLSWEKQDF